MTALRFAMILALLAEAFAPDALGGEIAKESRGCTACDVTFDQPSREAQTL